VNEVKEDNAFISKPSNLLINLKDGGFVSLSRILKIVEVSITSIIVMMIEKSFKIYIYSN
jgi:hypothetical protein